MHETVKKLREAAQELWTSHQKYIHVTKGSTMETQLCNIHNAIAVLDLAERMGENIELMPTNDVVSIAEIGNGEIVQTGEGAFWVSSFGKLMPLTRNAEPWVVPSNKLVRRVQHFVGSQSTFTTQALEIDDLRRKVKALEADNAQYVRQVEEQRKTIVSAHEVRDHQALAHEQRVAEITQKYNLSFNLMAASKQSEIDRAKSEIETRAKNFDAVMGLKDREIGELKEKLAVAEKLKGAKERDMTEFAEMLNESRLDASKLRRALHVVEAHLGSIRDKAEDLSEVANEFNLIGKVRDTISAMYKLVMETPKHDVPSVYERSIGRGIRPDLMRTQILELQDQVKALMVKVFPRDPSERKV